MENLATFIFWTSIYLAILAIVQWTVPRRLAGPQHNRWFILLGLMTVLVMGILVLLPDEHMIKESRVTGYQLPEVVVGTSSGLEYSKQEIYQAFSTQRILFYLSLGVSFFLFVRLLASIFFLIIRIGFSRKMIRCGCTILPVKKQMSPFSFFHFVFIPERLLADSNLSAILLHEKAHMAKMHSIDLVFMEILTVLYWFHPAIWYLRHELKMQQEYEADQYVLNTQYDKKAYQKLLLAISFPAYSLAVTNPFTYSPLKKRMMMMNKKFRKNRSGTVAGILLIVPLFFLVLVLQAFEHVPETIHSSEKVSEKLIMEQEYEDDVIFTVVEDQPKFPGGEDARVQFLQDNLEYPEKSKEAGIQGTVFVSFVVEKDGSLSNIQVLRGVNAELDEESVRVVKAMPDWIPGRQRGEKVRVQFNLPIRFHLGEDEKPQKPESDDAAYLIIIEEERYTITDSFDMMELNALIPVEEIGHIEMLTGKDAEPYGYKRVIKISRKEELKFFRGE